MSIVFNPTRQTSKVITFGDLEEELKTYTSSSTFNNAISNLDNTKIGSDTVDTLTNKTIGATDNIITTDFLQTTTGQVNIVSTAPLTGQILIATDATNATWQNPPETGITADSVDTLTNKTINADQNTISNIDNDDIKVFANIDADKCIEGTINKFLTVSERGNISSNTSHVSSNNVHGVGVGNDVVGTGTTQTLTNKTINTASNTITVDATDVGSGTFDNARITSGNITQHEGSITIGNLINAPVGAVVGTTDTQTLSNKSFSNNLDMTNNKIVNVATPTLDDDAVPKKYVDGLLSGLDIKTSVKLATQDDFDSNTTMSLTTYDEVGGLSGRGQFTSTLITSNSLFFDGVELTSADNGARILVKSQTIGDENGIYTITISGTSLTLDRATDFDSDVEVSAGAFCFVEEGSASGNSGYVLVNNDPITIGGTSGTVLNFSKFSAVGLDLSGYATKTGVETLTNKTIGVGGLNLDDQNLLNVNDITNMGSLDGVLISKYVVDDATQTLTNKTYNTSLNTFTVGSSLSMGGFNLTNVNDVLADGNIKLSRTTGAVEYNAETTAGGALNAGYNAKSLTNTAQFGICQTAGNPASPLVTNDVYIHSTNGTSEIRFLHNNVDKLRIKPAELSILANMNLFNVYNIQNCVDIDTQKINNVTLSGDVVSTTATQTLSNKTLAGATMTSTLNMNSNNITNVGTINTKSLPTGDIVGTTDTQTLSNKTITDAVSVSVSSTNPFNLMNTTSGTSCPRFILQNAGTTKATQGLVCTVSQGFPATQIGDMWVKVHDASNKLWIGGGDTAGLVLSSTEVQARIDLDMNSNNIINMSQITWIEQASAGVPNNTLFLDSSDNKLKFKNASGQLKNVSA